MSLVTTFTYELPAEEAPRMLKDAEDDEDDVGACTEATEDIARKRFADAANDVAIDVAAERDNARIEITWQMITIDKCKDSAIN
jgi:hypothetical protein